MARYRWPGRYTVTIVRDPPPVWGERAGPWTTNGSVQWADGRQYELTRDDLERFTATPSDEWPALIEDL